MSVVNARTLTEPLIVEAYSASGGVRRHSTTLCSEAAKMNAGRSATVDTAAPPCSRRLRVRPSPSRIRHPRERRRRQLGRYELHWHFVVLIAPRRLACWTCSSTKKPRRKRALARGETRRRRPDRGECHSRVAETRRGSSTLHAVHPGPCADTLRRTLARHAPPPLLARRPPLFLGDEGAADRRSFSAAKPRRHRHAPAQSRSAE